MDLYFFTVLVWCDWEASRLAMTPAVISPGTTLVQQSPRDCVGRVLSSPDLFRLPKSLSFIIFVVDVTSRTIFQLVPFGSSLSYPQTFLSDVWLPISNDS